MNNKIEFELLRKMQVGFQNIADLFGEYVARNECRFFDAPKGFTLVSDEPTTIEHPNRNASSPAPKQEDEVKISIDIKGVSISKKPRKDGRIMGYVVIDGKRNYQYGFTRKEVEEKLAKILKGERKVNPKKECSTLGEWIDKFILLFKKDKVKPKTYENIGTYANRIKREIGSTKLTALNGIMIQEYIESLPTQSIKRRVYIILNEALEKAYKGGLIKSNPCAMVDCPKQDTAKKTAITKENVEHILSCVKEKYKHFIPLYRLLYATGLRVGEALALTDNDFDNGKVKVTKNVVFMDGKRIEQTPKTKASVRTVVVPKQYMPKLTKGVVFPYTYEQVADAFKAAAVKAGFTGVTLHTLRHSYATSLTEAGVPPKVKQALMGHGSLDMTENVYTDVLPSFMEACSTKIEDFFAGNKEN